MSEDAEPLYEPTDSVILPEFEGQVPIGVVTAITGSGQRITRPIHYMEKGVLLVEFEATNIGHKKTNDGMKRVHTLAVVDLYELDGEEGQKLLRQKRAQWRVADDASHGRQSLGLDDTAQPVLSVDGVILTALELAERQGVTVAEDTSFLVEFDTGDKGIWPEDWLASGQSLAAVGGRMRLVGSEVGDTAQVMRWLDIEDPTVVLAEWTEEDEAARLLELEHAAEVEEAKADREVAEGMARPPAGESRIGPPWPGYGSMSVTDLKRHVGTVDDVDLLHYAADFEKGHKGRVTLMSTIGIRLDELAEGGE